MSIHSTAIIHPSVKVPENCIIGPSALVDKEVELADGVELGPHCHIYPGVNLGKKVKIFDGAVIGSEPQDLKYNGEKTRVTIGDKTIIREYVTINTGTAAYGQTEIGSNCMLMAYCHVAHDCIIGDNVIVANSVQMGGHVRIGHASVISGLTGIHQFTTIGPGVFIGGGLRVARDIPPFSRAMGEPLTWAGINTHALIKIGYSNIARRFLMEIYKNLNTGSVTQTSELLVKRKGEKELNQMIVIWRDFFENQTRGILRRK